METGQRETKQKGLCPFCEQIVAPVVVVEKNNIRRDRCECPSCKEAIYLCRVPGCHDFAKGTSTYDHEFCPACTDSVAEGGKTAVKAAWDVAKFAVPLILASAGAAAKKK
jgi:hypothetical protein